MDDPADCKLMAAVDRQNVPPGCGMVELRDTSGHESAAYVVRELYSYLDGGEARSQRLQPKYRENRSVDQMIVFVPESDLADLQRLWTSDEMKAARKRVMQQTKRRAPRLTFVWNDGAVLS